MRKIIALTLLLAVFVSGCREEVKTVEPVRPVRVFKVSADANPELRTFPGKVKASREVSLAFRVPGQIVELDVKEGDLVKEGQLVAMLDQRDFQAAVADLQAKLSGARSVLKEARLNIERNQKLIDKKIIAQSAFDAAQSNYETSRANALSLEQSLRRAKLNLQYTRLEAPFTGTIAIKHADKHEYIQAKEAIVQLEDISSLDVVVDIPETVWVRAFNGGSSNLDEVVARFESFPGRVFPLRMKEFQTKSNPGTQTYEVTLTMDNPDGVGVRPGMTAEVMGRMPQNGEKLGISIPFSSVVGNSGGEKYVWVLKDSDTVSKRVVEVGRIMNDMFLVHDGIVPGEILVVAGVNYLQEGQKVKVLKGRIGGRE